MKNKKVEFRQLFLKNRQLKDLPQEVVSHKELAQWNLKEIYHQQNR